MGEGAQAAAATFTFALSPSAAQSCPAAVTLICVLSAPLKKKVREMLSLKLAVSLTTRTLQFYHLRSPDTFHVQAG